MGYRMRRGTATLGQYPARETPLIVTLGQGGYRTDGVYGLVLTKVRTLLSAAADTVNFSLTGQS